MKRSSGRSGPRVVGRSGSVRGAALPGSGRSAALHRCPPAAGAPPRPSAARRRGGPHPVPAIRATGAPPTTVDYTVYRRTADLESTGYVEIGPGRHAGRHWQDGFLFVWADAFGMAEGIIARHLPGYDHFEMNDVPRAAGLRIIADWRAAADRLPTLDAAAAHAALDLDASYGCRLDDEPEAHRTEIAAMLGELADACERFYRDGEWVCMLGL